MTIELENLKAQLDRIEAGILGILGYLEQYSTSPEQVAYVRKIMGGLR